LRSPSQLARHSVGNLLAKLPRLRVARLFSLLIKFDRTERIMIVQALGDYAYLLNQMGRMLPRSSPRADAFASRQKYLKTLADKVNPVGGVKGEIPHETAAAEVNGWLKFDQIERVTILQGCGGFFATKGCFLGDRKTDAFVEAVPADRYFNNLELAREKRLTIGKLASANPGESQWCCVQPSYACLAREWTRNCERNAHLSGLPLGALLHWLARTQ
jgi:hypothetical protein